MRIKSLKFLSFLFIGLILFSACGGDYTPKPKAYHRIIYPERNFIDVQPPSCPFEFEYPDYARTAKDSLFFNREQKNPCWLDVVFDHFKGVIHLSYEPINSKADFIRFTEDAHKMTFKHTVKAESIEEKLIQTENNVGGILYDVGGDAASSIQFFLTDTNSHFIRGALYFNNTPNSDSIAPVIRFVKDDMMHLINTFKWK